MTAISRFQEQFGLGWKQETSSTSPQRSDYQPDDQPSTSNLPPGLQDAILAYSSKVMSVMKSAPQTGVRVFDLAEQSSIRMETLLPVMHYLTEKGFAERVAVDDKVGNDTYRLTPLGQQLSS
jgi:hypothetical protein